MPLRIAICGAPRTGKTTLAHRLANEGIFSFTYSAPVRSTDDLIPLGWSEASAEAAKWFNDPGDWVIEGVTVARALRKWLQKHPQGMPCDQLYILRDPWEKLKPGQATMAKGVTTVLEEILPPLKSRGVEIIYSLLRVV